MTALETAVKLAKPFEGLRLKPYLCPAGIPTIGYGSTFYTSGKKVTLQDPPITIDYAEKLLLFEMNNCIRKTFKYCPHLIRYPQRLGAIADFTFNLGAGRLQISTLRRKVNQEDWKAAKRELMKWVRGGGRILPGLVRRRQAEGAFL